MKIKVKQKDEHSMFSNMMFFMSLLFKASPLLVIGELIWGVMNNLPSQRFRNKICYRYCCFGRKAESYLLCCFGLCRVVNYKQAYLLFIS